MKRNILLSISTVALLVLVSLSAIRTRDSSANVAPTKTFVIPNLVETNGAVDVQQLADTSLIPRLQGISGRSGKAEFNFDTHIYVTYAGGLGGVKDSGPVEVALFVFEHTKGQPLKSATGNDVCNPCSFQLIPQPVSQRRIILHDLIESAGGFGQDVNIGYAVTVVSGSGADTVNIFSFISNSTQAPFNLSVLGYAPEEVRAPSP
jgi:hypothetical protein